MVGLQVEVRGLRELTEELRKLPEDIQRKAMKGAMQAGAEPIADEAANIIRSRSLRMARAVTVRVSSDTAVSEIEARIGSGKDAPDAHLSEFGTSAHEVKVRNKKVLAQAVTGVTSRVWQIFGKKVKHPGSRPFPYMRPAFERRKKDALEAIRSYLAGALARITK